MNALVLAAPHFSWWERFRRGQAHPTPEAAEHWSRWRRARELGAPDDHVHPEDGLVRGDALRAHQEPVEPFVAEVRELFAQTAAAAATHDFKLLVADPSGVVVHTGGGGAFAPVARQMRLIEGANWSEARRGTNAIGTAIAELRPAAVHGAAHYARSFHELVCYASPIRDIDGTVIAVLDASSLVGRAEPAVGALVAAAALAMEASWRARAWARIGAQAVGLVERTIDRVAEPALLVEATGRVVRCNTAARVALGARPADIRAAVGLGWPELKAAALGGGIVALPRFGASGVAQARLEPLLDAEAGLLAVALFVEPSRRRVRVAEPPVVDPFAQVYAEDRATRAAVDLGRRVAPSNLPVVLLAETGSGKERFAEALHAASHRAAGPFVAVNCGSFAPELLAAELFGYGPGAFTGADRQGREGLLAAASGGTLFLDEVGEMPPAMQAALLRVLEDGRYERVGERTPRRADVRVICATCRDLPALVASGNFRGDLWFRLRGVVLRLPPLRAREDILGLARFLLAARSPGPPEIGPALAEWLLRQPWPGNVRELRSVLDVALVLADGAPVLGIEHLPPEVELPAVEAAATTGSLQEVEVHTIRRALDACAGNVSAAARRLGIARSTVYRVLRRG